MIEKHFGCSRLKEVGSQSLQMAIRQLDMAFTKFFKQQGGYPKFTKDRIKIKYHRIIPKNSLLKQATISRHNNQYFISILVEDYQKNKKALKIEKKQN